MNRINFLKSIFFIPFAGLLFIQKKKNNADKELNLIKQIFNANRVFKTESGRYLVYVNCDNFLDSNYSTTVNKLAVENSLQKLLIIPDDKEKSVKVPFSLLEQIC